MTTLYNCHTDGDQYRITKFDSLGNVESSYLCTVDECECPAGHRPSCRHRHMLPRFIAKGAVNSFYFYDYDRQGWVTNEPAQIEYKLHHEQSHHHDEEQLAFYQAGVVSEPAITAILSPNEIIDDIPMIEETSKPAPTSPEPTLRRRI